MLLEIEFQSRPDAAVREHFDDPRMLQRQMFHHLHQVLAPGTNESPPEAVELGFSVGWTTIDAVDPNSPIEWSFGRIAKLRISVD